VSGPAAFSQAYFFVRGHAVAQLVEALGYKVEGRVFDTQLEFVTDLILAAALSL
jgi:hypothetical protein